MPTTEDIIRSAHLADSDAPIYHVGPYGRRVNFTAQQRRALNLVWALNESKRFEALPTVAVIGAGIGGLMTAAALRACGCIVRIFEAKGAPLTIQSGAQHRFIHPTIGFWPHEELKSTTRLPFFDWYSSLSSEVMSILQQEWLLRFRPKMPEAKYGHVLRKLAWRPHSSHVELQFTNGSTTQVSIVFIATGFAEEENQRDKHQFRYWQDNDDDIKARTPGRCKNNKRNYVSGTGDGGLIDYLRIIHTNYDSGRLCARFLGMINEKAVANEVAKIEAEESARHMRANTAEKRDKLSRYYWKRYVDLFSLLPIEAVELLDDSLQPQNPATLIGPHRSPLQQGASPIHKIMTCHAFLPNRPHARNSAGQPLLEYVQGRLRQEGARFYIDQPDGQSSQINYDVLIIRHGPKPSLRGFGAEHDAALDSLRADQMQLDDSGPLKFQDGYFTFPGYPAHDTRCRAFVNMRAELARRFTLRRYAGNIAVGGTDQDSHFLYQPIPDLIVTEPFDDLPEELFGIRIVQSEDVPLARSLAGHLRDGVSR